MSDYAFSLENRNGIIQKGISKRNINKVVSGERKKAGGFEWRKADKNYFKK